MIQAIIYFLKAPAEKIRACIQRRAEKLAEGTVGGIQNKVFGFYCHCGGIQTNHCGMEGLDQCDKCKTYELYVLRRGNTHADS